jgi:hypothetical protein
VVIAFCDGLLLDQYAERPALSAIGRAGGAGQLALCVMGHGGLESIDRPILAFGRAEPGTERLCPIRTRLHFRNRIEKRPLKDISLAGGSQKTRSSTDTQRPCSEKGELGPFENSKLGLPHWS